MHVSLNGIDCALDHSTMSCIPPVIYPRCMYLCNANTLSQLGHSKSGGGGGGGMGNGKSGNGDMCQEPRVVDNRLHIASVKIVSVKIVAVQSALAAASKGISNTKIMSPPSLIPRPEPGNKASPHPPTPDHV